MLGRDISADDKHAAHFAFEIYWTKAIRPPNVLATTVTRYRHQLVLIPGRPLTRHDVFDLGANDVPYLGPTITAPRSQSARMPFGPHRLAIGIVIELDELWSPPNEHWVTRGENEPHRNSKTLRPRFRRAEGCLVLIKCSCQSAHFAVCRQEVVDFLPAHARNLTSDARRQTYRQSSAKYNRRPRVNLDLSGLRDIAVRQVRANREVGLTRAM